MFKEHIDKYIEYKKIETQVIEFKKDFEALRANLENDKSKTIKQKDKELVEYRNKFPQQISKYYNTNSYNSFIEFIKDFETKYINPILQKHPSFNPKEVDNVIFDIRYHIKDEIKK